MGATALAPDQPGRAEQVLPILCQPCAAVQRFTEGQPAAVSLCKSSSEPEPSAARLIARQLTVAPPTPRHAPLNTFLTWQVLSSFMMSPWYATTGMPVGVSARTASAGL